MKKFAEVQFIVGGNSEECCVEQVLVEAPALELEEGMLPVVAPIVVVLETQEVCAEEECAAE